MEGSFEIVCESSQTLKACSTPRPPLFNDEVLCADAAVGSGRHFLKAAAFEMTIVVLVRTT
jgi:hypothetical protein